MLTLRDIGRSVPLGTLGISGAFDYSYLIFDNSGRRLAAMTTGGALSIVDVIYRPGSTMHAILPAGTWMEKNGCLTSAMTGHRRLRVAVERDETIESVGKTSFFGERCL